MKTKKNNPKSAEPEKPPESTAASNGAEPHVEGKDRFNLSFDLNADGAPDFSSMREKTKERARQFFSDPKMAEAFGVKPVAQATAVVDYFPMAPGEKYPAVIGSMYNTIGVIESLLAQRFAKIPEPIARRVFTYTDEEKMVLAGPTSRVLNKYMPLWLIKYQDEIALANLLISITVAKVNAAIMLARMNQTPSAPNAPEPTPEPEPNKSQVQ